MSEPICYLVALKNDTLRGWTTNPPAGIPNRTKQLVLGALYPLYVGLDTGRHPCWLVLADGYYCDFDTHPTECRSDLFRQATPLEVLLGSTSA